MTRGGVTWVEEDAVASSHQFNDRLNFDPDASNDGLPNIMGACDPVTVDTTVEPRTWEWKIQDGTPIVQTVSNSTGNYTVTTTNFREFQMHRFKCDWTVNLWMTGDHLEVYPAGYTHYNDVEVILRIEPNNFVYFDENPAKYYVAPAYIALAEAPVWSYMTDGVVVRSGEVASYQSIFPGAKGETLGVYYHADGGRDVTVEKLLSYNGFTLDPKVFRDEYYLRVGLDVWMPVTTWGPFRPDWFEKLPSVQLNFVVYTFVVGEWQVQMETSEKIEMEPHQPQERDPPKIIDLPDVDVAGFLDNLPWQIKTSAWLIFFAIVVSILVGIVHWNSKKAKPLLKKGKQRLDKWLKAQKP
jgi:hypothetical protein